MYRLDWTSDQTLEGERLAYLGAIPILTFACTFWLLVVGKPILFAASMLASILVTILIVRNHTGTRITIDDRYFRFGRFQRISLKNISSVRVVPTTIGANQILEVGTLGDEGESFNLRGVPEEVRVRIVSILEQHLDAT